MRRILFLLLVASIAFAQSTPNKIGKLSKSDFEKWIKPLTLDGHKFAMFSHETDSYQAGFLKGTKTVNVMAREDDGSFKESTMKQMGYTTYERKGLKHFFVAYDEMSLTTVIIPKYGIQFTVGGQGKLSKDYLDKLIDQTKIYEK